MTTRSSTTAELYAIGAENHDAIDFLAPYFLLTSGYKIDVVYFADVNHNLHPLERELHEQLECFGADGVPPYIESRLIENLVAGLGTNYRDVKAYDIVRALYDRFPSPRSYRVLYRPPTLDEIGQLARRLIADESLLGRNLLRLRASRSRLDLLSESTGRVRIEALGLNRTPSGLSIGPQSSEASLDGVEDAQVHCGGDYAILRTLCVGTPAFIPWYQRSTDLPSSVWFEALLPFEPIYSRRITRHTAIRDALAGQAVTVGYFWHLNLNGLEPDLLEFFREVMPDPLVRAFCDMAVRPTIAPSLRRRAAVETVRGALSYYTLLHDEGLWRLIRGVSRALPQRGFFAKLALMVASYRYRHVLARLCSGQAVAENEIEDLSRAGDWASRILREDSSSYWDRSDFVRYAELLVRSAGGTRADQLSSCRDTIRELASHEPPLLASLATDLVAIWDWADKLFRWSSSRSLALDVRPAPNPAYQFGGTTVVEIDLPTAKIVRRA